VVFFRVVFFRTAVVFLRAPLDFFRVPVDFLRPPAFLRVAAICSAPWSVIERFLPEGMRVKPGGGLGISQSVKDGAENSRLDEITPGELTERVERGDVFVVDVRRSTGSEQIYGAIRYNPRHLLDAARLALPLPKTGSPAIVLYDETGEGPDLESIAAKLRQNGYALLGRLAGGFDAWKIAARRTEEASLEQPVPPVHDEQLER
jgi:rhodanese-related sulfurtransferase